MAPVNFSLVCFRYRKEGAGEDEMARLNSKLIERVNASGKVCLTHTTLKGVYTIRMAIGQRTTAEKHVHQAWDLISKHADELA